MSQISTSYQFAFSFVESTHQSLFITGKAGTGKTTFLRTLQEKMLKPMAVVAPTGIAAINAEGVTIHSFFQLPLRPFIPTEEGRKELISTIKMNGRRRKVLQRLELLVIDEVSMVRADTLDAIDTVLRHFKYRKEIPFGGVQVIFIGDLYQLSPVCPPSEQGILSRYYRSYYFFDSLVLQEQKPLCLEFETIFRQKDTRFIELLNAVRNNTVSQEQYNLLQKRYLPNFVIPKGQHYVTLTTHNAKADAINQEALAALTGKTVRYKASIVGNFPENIYPTDAALELKRGAVVMFLKNDKENPKRYYNGKIATVKEWDATTVTLESEEDTEPIVVEPAEWQNVSYQVNEETGQIEEELLGTFRQFPLRLAWAITVHKSQGLTFDRAIIDVQEAFAFGQVYVALSRCRTYEGLVLRTPIQPSSLRVDTRVATYSSQRIPQQGLQDYLQEAQTEQIKNILFSIFEFSSLLQAQSRLQQYVQVHAKKFTGGAENYLRSLQQLIFPWHGIALRFQVELKQILSDLYPEKKKTEAENSAHRLPQEARKYLQKRIGAAAAYYLPLLEKLQQIIIHSPVKTFNKECAEDYDNGLNALSALAFEKQMYLRAIQKEFSLTQYYKTLNAMHIPTLEWDTHQIKEVTPTKKKKVPTEKITIELFHDGFEPASIARERNLTLPTIQAHLLKGVASGEVSVYSFVDMGQLQRIRKQYHRQSIADLYQDLDGKIEFFQLRVAVTFFENEGALG